MATHRAPAGLSIAAPALRRRAGRWLPAALLAAAVLGWHAWLMGLLGLVGLPGLAGLAGVMAPSVPPAGPVRPGLVQLRSLPAAPVPAAAQAQRVQAPPDDGALPPAAATAVAARRLPAVATTPAAPPIEVAPAPAVPSTAPPLDAPAPGPAPVDAVADAAAHTDTDTATDAGPAGEPPPRYATRVPPPAQLRYALRLNGQAGEALLVWQHDGQRYRLTLDGQGPGGTPLLAQASDGLLDGDGLAPERYVDRRRGGRAQAANFRRDIGRIGYSGPPQQHPAWPGAQDRLSWLVQLVAILAASGDAVPPALQLFVTDARGHAGLWQLQRQPDEAATTPWGDAILQHWQREPPRPEGLRVDVWLPAEAAGPAGPWPLRLRFMVPRSGDVVELLRLAPP